MQKERPRRQDGPFWGYLAQVAVCTRGGMQRRPSSSAGGAESASLASRSINGRAARAHGRWGVGPAAVLADCGYSFKTGFARRLRKIGADPVMDLHRSTAGRKGTFEGAICANGEPLYAPLCLIASSSSPAQPGRLASSLDVQDRSCAELNATGSPPKRPDGMAYERVMCPAAAGKLRCP